jgi:AraC-like DNA-binding protein
MLPRKTLRFWRSQLKGLQGRPGIGPSRDYFSEVDTLADFSLSLAGLQQCAPGHHWHGKRRHPILHFVLAGKGSFQGPHGVAALESGQIFYMAAGEAYEYRADPATPWMYLWIELRGRQVVEWMARAGLDPAKPLWKGNGFPEIMEHAKPIWQCLVQRRSDRDLLADALLHRLLVSLTVGGGVLRRSSRSPRQGSPVPRVLDFIHQHVGHPIRIGRLAELVGLHRSQLAARFRRETGKSIRDYLLRHRMDEACRLLHETNLTVREVADSVGYPSYVAFAIRFKAMVQMSPLHWRARQRRVTESLKQ